MTQAKDDDACAACGHIRYLHGAGGCLRCDIRGGSREQRCQGFVEPVINAPSLDVVLAGLGEGVDWETIR